MPSNNLLQIKKKETRSPKAFPLGYNGLIPQSNITFSGVALKAVT